MKRRFAARRQRVRLMARDEIPGRKPDGAKGDTGVDPFAKAGKWKVPAELTGAPPAAERGAAPPLPEPSSPPAPEPSPQPAEPGEFTQLFQAGGTAPPPAQMPTEKMPAASSAPAQSSEPATPPPVEPPAPAAPQPPAASEPGEFTRMFQPGQVADSPKSLPTQSFSAATPAPEAPSPPREPAPAVTTPSPVQETPPQPAEPGEFTQLFQAGGTAPPPAQMPT